MKKRVLSWTLRLLALAALFSAARLCLRPYRESAAAQDVRAVLTDTGNSALEMSFAILGGFRGLLSEVVWFRMDRLQEEGRYGELAQLAAYLTHLEPHTPDVWSYAAWNLAFNVSASMPTPEERWRWVLAGMRLLRDDGLRLNPGNPVIARDLSWLFLVKIGGPLDEAGPYYRKEWADAVEKAQASGDWSWTGLEEPLRTETEKRFGPQDWRQPEAAALYWAMAGVGSAKGPLLGELRRFMFQALLREALADPSKVAVARGELDSMRREMPAPDLEEASDAFRKRFGM